jgi:hypothetical protein
VNATVGAAAKAGVIEVDPLTSRVEPAPSRVYQIDPLSDSRWATFIERHPRSSVFHSPNWLKALRTVHGYEPVATTTCPPNVPLTNGLVFCRIESWLTGRRLVSLPFSDHCEPLVDSPIELSSMLTHIRQQVDQGLWKYMELRPIASEPNCSAGLSRMVTYYFHCLDLRPGIEQLFRRFHKDCVQRKILRAEREKLQYEEGRSEDLLSKFYPLLVMTRRRQCLPPQSMHWFRGLIATFGEDLKIRVASKNGVSVASILTLSHKKSMVYKYGCSNGAFSNLGGTALLFWKVIQEAKERGFEELEMGRSDADNLGLVAFKERWGASGKLINYWTYPQRNATGLPTLWKSRLARHLVATVPDLALEIVGEFLYKHVG